MLSGTASRRLARLTAWDFYDIFFIIENHQAQSAATTAGVPVKAEDEEEEEKGEEEERTKTILMQPEGAAPEKVNASSAVVVAPLGPAIRRQ